MQASTSGTASPQTTTFYTWRNYRCAYEVYQPATSSEQIGFLLIHPVGVGLSKAFWHRFCNQWQQENLPYPLYNPDLLGCGESDRPRIAYTPEDWAEQLQHFLQTVVQKPVVVISQGALLPVAIALVQKQPDLIKGLVLAGPPAWAVMTEASETWQQRIIWNLLDSPLGNAFYRYARRQEFLRSFSAKQLFAEPQDIDAEWLETLEAGAANSDSRYAVFSFLAGFWRKDYSKAIASISQPTLVAIGETASSISKVGKTETPSARMAHYLDALPHARGCLVPGRNVLPYESTSEFIRAVVPFIQGLS